MSENNYLSPVFVNDINERLEKNFSDEEVRKQNFNTIQNIAKNLNIGKKFKVPQAELLLPALREKSAGIVPHKADFRKIQGH